MLGPFDDFNDWRKKVGENVGAKVRHFSRSPSRSILNRFRRFGQYPRHRMFWTICIIAMVAPALLPLSAPMLLPFVVPSMITTPIAVYLAARSGAAMAIPKVDSLVEKMAKKTDNRRASAKPQSDRSTMKRIRLTDREQEEHQRSSVGAGIGSTEVPLETLKRVGVKPEVVPVNEPLPSSSSGGQRQREMVPVGSTSDAAAAIHEKSEPVRDRNKFPGPLL